MLGINGEFPILHRISPLGFLWAFIVIAQPSGPHPEIGGIAKSLPKSKF